jgi:glucose uptake protein
MILPQTYPQVLALMILSLLCLGSWAAMFKLAGKWRFELFYFPFALGVMVAVLIYSFTVGNLGYDGFNFLDDLQHAGKRQWMYAFLAGLIFNLANMLLMAAVSVMGMALAFPLAIGIAVLVTTGVSAILRTAGNPMLVTLGCVLLLTAVVVGSVAHRLIRVARHEELARAGQAKSTRRPGAIKGTLLALATGLLMGSFQPLVGKAADGEVGLGPYGLAAMFVLGMFISTPVFNIFLMNLPVEGEPVDFASFFASKPKQHVLGIIAGAIWCTGMLASLVASAAPPQMQGGPLEHYMLAQSWPLLAALWGMLAFGDLRSGDARAKIMGLLMLVLYVCGLAMIGLGPIYIAGKG